MYEPEKILVQNAGIDPGVAALLQILMEYVHFNGDNYHAEV
nr:MAG TPA: glutamine synthetase [Caudoviricetes sp.]